METILGFIIAGAGAGVWLLMKKLAADRFIQKFGPIISSVFDVVDPIAGDLITKYEGSEVQNALYLAVARVADGDLDQEDVNAITAYVTEKFDPSLAAAKVLDPESEKGKATLELAESLKQLHDGTNLTELVQVARKATAIF